MLRLVTVLFTGQFELNRHLNIMGITNNSLCIAKRILKQRSTFYVSAADMLRLDMRSGENYVYTLQIVNQFRIL